MESIALIAALIGAEDDVVGDARRVHCPAYRLWQFGEQFGGATRRSESKYLRRTCGALQDQQFIAVRMPIHEALATKRRVGGDLLFDRAGDWRHPGERKARRRRNESFGRACEHPHARCHHGAKRSAQSIRQWPRIDPARYHAVLCSPVKGMCDDRHHNH